MFYFIAQYVKKNKWIQYLMNIEKLVDTMFEQGYKEPEIGV